MPTNENFATLLGCRQGASLSFLIGKMTSQDVKDRVVLRIREDTSTALTVVDRR